MMELIVMEMMGLWGDRDDGGHEGYGVMEMEVM